MSGTAKRIGGASLMLGLAGSAFFGAVGLSGRESAALFLYASAAFLLLASLALFFWPQLRRAILALAASLEDADSGTAGVEFQIEARLFQGVDVLVAALGGATGEISGREFRDCRIVGPAILAPTEEGTEFIVCDFGAADQVLWPVAAGREPEGCIRLYGCIFYRCVFENVGLAVPAADIASWAALFTGSPEAAPPTTAPAPDQPS